MKLVTAATADGPRACVWFQDRYVDLHAADSSLPTSMRELLAMGREGLARAAAAAANPRALSHDPGTTRLLAPVPDPRKVLCLGLNYRDHAIESNMPIPEEPVLFGKFPNAVIGPESPVLIPAESSRVDYEAELVIVVGAPARRVSRERAMEHVAGFAVGHDVSARDWQLEKPGKQWIAGKTFDTFAPVGPALVTSDEIPDPHALRIALRLNGRTMQDSNTSQMIFKTDEIVSYLSRIMTLEPGDLIFTGTPPGVGMSRTPPVWLKDGDVVEVEIEGLGTLRNPCRADG